MNPVNLPTIAVNAYDPNAERLNYINDTDGRDEAGRRGAKLKLRYDIQLSTQIELCLLEVERQ